jgi:serine/threonine protein phosphatase PrpC
MDDEKSKDPITEYSLSCGCTANVAIITKDAIYCANSGDSRCVMARGT